MPITVIWCGDKIGSFVFACVSACAVRVKPNVPMCGGHNFKIFSAVDKKIRAKALGCYFGKKSAVKFIRRPVVSMIFCQFNGCFIGHLDSCLLLFQASSIWVN